MNLQNCTRVFFELEIWQHLSTFFVDDLYQKLSLFHNLLGLWHSYLGPQPIWTRPWQDWKSVFMKLQKCTRVFFELEIWQRVKYFFRRWPISNIISVSEPTRNMTLRLRTSTHFNKSLTRLKITFHKTAQEYFLSSKFDNVLGTFFVDDLYQNLSLFWDLLGLWQSYLGPQPIWTIRWQDWKSVFMKLQNCTTVFFELEIWQRVKFFFRRWPISNIISVSEPTRTRTHLLRTSTYLKESLTRLKISFHKSAQEYFLSSKFDNVLSTFFVDDLYQIISPFQNLLGLWHSYLGPQPIWTSPWQDWKSFLMKLHKSIFWARNLTIC